MCVCVCDPSRPFPTSEHLRSTTVHAARLLCDHHSIWSHTLLQLAKS